MDLPTGMALEVTIYVTNGKRVSSTTMSLRQMPTVEMLTEMRRTHINLIRKPGEAWRAVPLEELKNAKVL